MLDGCLMCRGRSVSIEVLVCSELSHSGRDERKVKPIDACIAPLVAALDAAGVHMLGSCCGHGVRAPSLVLAQDQRPAAALDALTAVDDRSWDLYQWQLVEVSDGGA